METNFYTCKNNTLYSTCIECLNKKVKCEICNKEFNKTYLSKHIERCFIEKVHLNDNNKEINNDNIGIYIEIDNNHETDAATLALHNNVVNRPLIVGPSFCGKTHSL